MQFHAQTLVVQEEEDLNDPAEKVFQPTSDGSLHFEEFVGKS